MWCLDARATGSQQVKLHTFLILGGNRSQDQEAWYTNFSLHKYHFKVHPPLSISHVVSILQVLYSTNTSSLSLCSKMHLFTCQTSFADVYVPRVGMGLRVPLISTPVIQWDTTAALGQHVFPYQLDMNVTVPLEKQENTVKEVRFHSTGCRMNFRQHLLPHYCLLRCHTAVWQIGANVSEEAATLDVSHTGGYLSVSRHAGPGSIQGPSMWDLGWTFASKYFGLLICTPQFFCNSPSEAGTMTPLVATIPTHSRITKEIADAAGSSKALVWYLTYQTTWHCIL